MSEIKNSGKTIGIDRIAIITALNFAKEIISLKENSVQLTEDSAQKIESIQNKLDLGHSLHRPGCGVCTDVQ